MTTLNHVKRNNRLIIVTIHQPRPEIFEMFDTLILLADGRVRVCSVDSCEETIKEYFKRSRKVKGRRKGKGRGGKGERRKGSGSEALAETEKFANAPAGNFSSSFFPFPSPFDLSFALTKTHSSHLSH